MTLLLDGAMLFALALFLACTVWRPHRPRKYTLLSADSYPPRYPHCDPYPHPERMTPRRVVRVLSGAWE